MSKRATTNSNATAPLGFEAKLWAAADALRNMNLAIRGIDCQLAYGLD